MAAGSNFPIKTVLDLTKCRIFRVNQRSTRAAFPMYVLLLNTTATNLEVSVEPELRLYQPEQYLASCVRHPSTSQVQSASNIPPKAGKPQRRALPVEN